MCNIDVSTYINIKKILSITKGFLKHTLQYFVMKNIPVKRKHKTLH